MQAEPAPATPRLHPFARAEARRTVQRHASETNQLPKPAAEPQQEEMEEGETSPPEYESEDEGLTRNLKELLQEMQGCKREEFD